jgi:hypothetical protein
MNEHVEDLAGFFFFVMAARITMPGNDEINIDAATRFPICAEPERLPPSRPRLFGGAQRPHGP